MSGPDLSPALIDRDWYRDPAVFGLERDRIFRRVWHFACLASEVAAPGDYFALTVAEQPLIVMRGKDGGLRAFLNACTHRGLALTEDCSGASGNFGHALRCMYHGWTYDTAGKLIGVPYPDAYGGALDRGALGLVPVKCESFGSFVFVAIDPLHPTLADFLGEAADAMAPAVQDLEVLGRVSWIYEGNWKLWHENFRDNYHPQFAHATVRDFTPDYAEGGSNHALTPGHSLLRWPVKPAKYDRFDARLQAVSGMDIDSRKAQLAGAPARKTDWRQILALFPNFDYQQQDAFASGIQVCHPLGVERTRVDIIYAAPQDDDEATRRYRLRTVARSTGCWGEVSVDDCEAAERATLGLRSLGTRYSPIGRGVAPGKSGDTMDEYSLREYYREYRSYVFG